MSSKAGPALPGPGKLGWRVELPVGAQEKMIPLYMSLQIIIFNVSPLLPLQNPITATVTGCWSGEVTFLHINCIAQ